MSETRKFFNAVTPITETFFEAIIQVCGLISVAKEEKNLKKQIEEFILENKQIEKQITSLKVSLKLVGKEEIISALKEIISIKEKELEKNQKSIEEFQKVLSAYSVEFEEYGIYIDRVYEFTKDLISFKEIEFKAFSEEEFISFIILTSNLGKHDIPKFDKTQMPIRLHDIIDNTNFGWNFFWDKVVENN